MGVGEGSKKPKGDASQAAVPRQHHEQANASAAQRIDGNAGEEDAGKVQLRASLPQAKHQSDSQKRAEKSRPRHGHHRKARSKGPRPEAEHGRRAEGRASGHSEEGRIGEGISQEGLQERAGEGKGRPHKRRQEGPGQAQFPEDGPGRRVLGERPGSEGHGPQQECGAKGEEEGEA